MRVATPVRTITWFPFWLLITSCSGSPGDVGDQAGLAPTAIITAIGHPYQTDADGSATTMTVRSQSEVTLSAKDSVNGSAPILDFSFAQTDSNERIATLTRVNNSVSFAAPAVTTETSYTFRLTVTDANREIDEAQVDIAVKPVPDPNRFLVYTRAPVTYTIVAVPAVSVPADRAADADDTLGEFTITVQRLLTYRDRSGTVHADVPLDVEPNPSAIQIQGAWLARTGASASCVAAPENPRFVLEIPSLDQDDLNVLVQSGDRSRQLELADIDEASLNLNISIAPRSGAITPGLCVLSSADPNQPLVAPTRESTRVSVQQLRGAPTDALDTLASATAYYRAIGDENAKTTFFEWLSANGFDRNAANLGADAHAVYTNNYDLGFGRDMYAKVGACDSPQLSIGGCDVSSVVINYPSLEGASKKLAPIVAVAMEYKATPTSGGRRIVKFYAYAPDARSAVGDYRRVHSVNLDGRGEKYIPEACTVCHGGTPGGLDSNGEYVNGGDVNGAFLPWDLDTLLFSDTDRSFSATDEALRAQLTRAAQEGELRKLNASAYLTYGDANRFALARELVSGWYRPGPLPVAQLDQVLSGSHFGAFVPPGWQASGLDGVATGSVPGSGNDDNPADAALIYVRVFAPYCRSCHTVQLPNSKVGDVRQAAFCDADRPMSERTVGAGRQRPIGCYWQMTSDPELAKRLSEGTMPFARLTMDRYWVPLTANETPAGELLATHLESTLGARGRVTTPGTPVATINLQFTNRDRTIEDETSTDIGHYVQLSAPTATFVWKYDWRVLSCSEPGNAASCTTSIATANANAAIASSRIEHAGQHRVELRVNERPDPVATQTFVVAEKIPRLAPTTTNKDFSIGASTPIDDLVSALGNGSAADHSVSVTVGSSELSVQPASCVAPSSCDANTVIVLSSSSLTPLASSFTLAVRDANDTAAVQATYPITITSALTIGDRTICARANSSGANLTSNLADCAAGTGFASSIDVLTLSSAAFGARTDLGVEFPNGTQTSLRNLGGHSGVLTATSSGSPARTRLVSYTPPLRLSTHTPTGENGLTNGGEPVFDTVPYRLVRFDADGAVVERSNTATLRIQINARTSFAADVMPLFSMQGCSSGGCHDGSSANRPNYAQSAAVVYAIFRAADGSYRNMINTVNGQPRAYVIPSEDPASLSNSGLLCWPMRDCSTGFHGNSDFMPDLQAIRLWIEDGANGF
jgi:hypothetical protein